MGASRSPHEQDVCASRTLLVKPFGHNKAKSNRRLYALGYQNYLDRILEGRFSFAYPAKSPCCADCNCLIVVATGYCEYCTLLKFQTVMKTEMRILGFDPGLAILGFGAILCQSSPMSDGAGSNQLTSRTQQIKAPKLLDFGIIQTPANTDIGERLCIIYDDLQVLMQQIQPDRVAVEKLFFYRMGNTIPVAQARGVLLLVLAQHKISPLEFTPAQVKQALTGYGNADKYAVQDAVSRELNLSETPRPDDAADALAVALTAWFQQ